MPGMPQKAGTGTSRLVMMGVVCILRQQTIPDDMTPITLNVCICSLLKTKISFGLAFFSH